MKIKQVISVVVLGLGLAGFTTAVSAQGRYANVYSRTQVENYVRQMEESSNAFRDAFRNEVNNSSLNSSTKRTYISYAEQFENSLDRLRRRFDSNTSWWQSRNEVQNVISSSQNLNNTMNTAAFRRRIERQWTALRNGINQLADTYDLPGLNGGGWSGGGGNPGNPGYPNGDGYPNGPNYPTRRGNAPTWAVGTFYARNPQTGGTIVMNIQRDGVVQLTFDGGAPTYASMNGSTLVNGPYVNRVTRLNNGIRTTNTANGDFIDYYRTPIAGGYPRGYPTNGGYPNNSNYPTTGGNVPSWALGTFYARNPQTGGTIMLGIERNGSVSISFDGNPPTYATMNGTTLVNGQYVNNVTRLKNGIRTTNTSNGDFIDYYRR